MLRRALAVLVFGLWITPVLEADTMYPPSQVFEWMPEWRESRRSPLDDRGAGAIGVDLDGSDDVRPVRTPLTGLPLPVTTPELHRNTDDRVVSDLSEVLPSVPRVRVWGEETAELTPTLMIGLGLISVGLMRRLVKAAPAES